MYIWAFLRSSNIFSSFFFKFYNLFHLFSLSLQQGWSAYSRFFSQQLQQTACIDTYRVSISTFYFSPITLIVRKLVSLHSLMLNTIAIFN